MAEIKWRLLDCGFHAYVDGKPTQFGIASQPPLWEVLDNSIKEAVYFTDNLDDAKEYIKTQLATVS